MLRFSISELSSLRWSFYQDVIRYAASGFTSIGIWRQKVGDCDVLEAADFLHEMRMNVSSVHWAGGFTGGSGTSYNDAIEDAIDAIHLTSRIQGDCLIVHPGCRNGHTAGHARRLLLSALRTLVPIATDFGVKLAIEPMPCRTASAWTFLETLDCSLNLLSEFSDENLGLVLDLYHVGLNPEVYENLENMINRIALVQLSDRDYAATCPERRLMLGTGNVPFDKWFRRLHEMGYAGNYEIELHGHGVAEVDYARMLSDSLSFLADLTLDVFGNPLHDAAQFRRPSSP